MLLSTSLYRDVRSSVLDWMKSVQMTDGTIYNWRMNEGADATIFTSCFALFILDLFGEVEKLPARHIREWAEHILSFQDEESGYFIDPSARTRARSETKGFRHLTQQLTCFCLSALGILGSSPRYPLTFLSEWPDDRSVKDYLGRIGCADGVRSSGNNAMFLGIFLSYQVERFRDESARQRLEAWFQWHNEHQNPNTGFWGTARRLIYYGGFQNALHQFLVFNYWNRPISYAPRIIDRILAVQDTDGFFAPWPGGASCYEYDALDTLVHLSTRNLYRRQEVIDALAKALESLVRTQNADGGFCQSLMRPKNAPELLQSLYRRRSADPYLYCYRAKATLRSMRPKVSTIRTGWTQIGRTWTDSNLWDTWFRCLAIAEVQTALSEADLPWRFHDVIGLGWFPSRRHRGKEVSNSFADHPKVST